MIIENAFLNALVADAPTHALVADRIYYVKAPQNVTTPYIVIQKISEVTYYNHSGGSDLSDARIQVTPYGKSDASGYKIVKDIIAAVMTVLDHYQGVLGGTGGVLIDRLFKDNEVDLWDVDTSLYYSPVDFIVAYHP